MKKLKPDVEEAMDLDDEEELQPITNEQSTIPAAIAQMLQAEDIQQPEIDMEEEEEEEEEEEKIGFFTSTLMAPDTLIEFISDNCRVSLIIFPLPLSPFLQDKTDTVIRKNNRYFMMLVLKVKVVNDFFDYLPLITSFKSALLWILLSI